MILDPDNHRIIYKNVLKRLYRDGDVVHKENPYKLDLAWRERMSLILREFSLPAFLSYIDNGYTTSFIDGEDLHGNRPFSYEKDPNQSQLGLEQKIEVAKLFGMLDDIGRKTGFTFGDVTCSNILVKDNRVFLIDYDDIVEYPLGKDYKSIWENTMDLVFSC
jgi:hypothetical protein